MSNSSRTTRVRVFLGISQLSLLNKIVPGTSNIEKIEKACASVATIGGVASGEKLFATSLNVGRPDWILRERHFAESFGKIATSIFNDAK